MRALINIFVLLFSFVLIIACKEEKLEEVIYEIPVEDRCIFTGSDVLLYSCSNGLTDTVVVKSVDFETETGTYTVSGVAMHNFFTDTQSILIELYNDNWNYGDIDSRCFRINTLPKYDDININNFPWCDLLNGSEYAGSKVIASKLADYDEKVFNGQTYKNVFYALGGDINNGYEIYWNLKYGIISFAGISNGEKLIWQFEETVF